MQKFLGGTLLAAAAISLFGGDLSVNPDNAIGKIKALHGVNRAPRLTQRLAMSFNRQFVALKPPMIRVADTPLNNIMWRSGDVNLIFPNWHADFRDRRNYYFDQTDEYIRALRATGAPLLYRLGESPDYSVDNIRLKPITDVEKWIQVASRIILRYNDGWGGEGGFRIFIPVWEIGSTPDVRGYGATWAGTLEEYYAFYATAAKKLKSIHPRVRFGGPAFSHPDREMRRAFLAYCRDKKAPLDFYSYYSYDDVPGVGVNTPREIRADLDEFGFKKTSIYLSSWGPRDPSMDSLDLAAFIASTLIRWNANDVPLDIAFYHNAGNEHDMIAGGNGEGRQGLGANNVSFTSYFGMLAASKLLSDYPRKLETGVVDSTVDAIAGRDDDGNCALLISCFRRENKELSIDFSRPLEYCQVEAVDKNHKLEPVGADMDGNTLKLKFDGSSGVFFIRFKPRAN